MEALVAHQTAGGRHQTTPLAARRRVGEHLEAYQMAVCPQEACRTGASLEACRMVGGVAVADRVRHRRGVAQIQVAEHLDAGHRKVADVDQTQGHLCPCLHQKVDSLCRSGRQMAASQTVAVACPASRMGAACQMVGQMVVDHPCQSPQTVSARKAGLQADRQVEHPVPAPHHRGEGAWRPKHASTLANPLYSRLAWPPPAGHRHHHGFRARAKPSGG